MYKLWFKALPYKDSPGEWWNQTLSQYTYYGVNSLERAIRGSEITHMVIDGSIPPDLRVIAPNLTHVCLRGVPRSSHLSRISKLSKLEVLLISGNNFGYGEGIPDVFNNFTSLRELDLSGCRLRTLPQSISKLNKLEVLRLDVNNFGSEGMPEIFANMTSLRTLNIGYSNISILPVSMSKLSKLEVLRMEKNNFESGRMPNIFAKMLSLRELDMSECNLTSVPIGMSKLDKLELLRMSGNNFESEGIPEVFTSMTSLRELDITGCRLAMLPESVKNLQKLQQLNIGNNRFTSLPAVICELKNLLTLIISENSSLVSLNAKILRLQKLLYVDTTNCKDLTSPPYEVCYRGISAIRQYYKDLAKGEGQSLPLVTIAIIGNAMAGKTSLIKTLQSDEKKRVLTNRNADAIVDEATKVFNVEEVRVDDTTLRVIDLGGQGVYHITYQLTLKQNCIPIVVVNMVQYKEQSDTSGHREAVRRLAFDWLTHLYLANPDLGPPKLVFTHKDKFLKESFVELGAMFLDTTEHLREEIVEETQQLGQLLTQIKHFSDIRTPFFALEDIYEVSNKQDDYMVYDTIKLDLLLSSRKFVKTLPQLWEDVSEKVLSIPAAFSTVASISAMLNVSGSSIFAQIFAMLTNSNSTMTEDHLKTILTYLHDCGKILSYDNIKSLRPYIFHKIAEVTKLLTVLYHHGEDVWQTRLQEFVRFLPVANQRFLEKEHFEELIADFRNTGIMDKRLLLYLIKTETVFQSDVDVQVAITLLQSFRLLYGPLLLQSKESFVVPYFCSEYHGNWVENNEDITLRVEIHFKGLSVPLYVYNQMSVEVLRMFPGRGSSITVKKNGVEIFHDNSYIYLVLDYHSRKVIIQVSSPVENISQSWKDIINITGNISREVKEAWPASRMVYTFFCPHCLLKGVSHPKRQIPPSWCDGDYSANAPTTYFDLDSGVTTVLCGKEKVPSPLLYPCMALGEEEKIKLKSAVEQLKEEREELQPAIAPCFPRTNANESTTSQQKAQAGSPASSLVTGRSRCIKKKPTTCTSSTRLQRPKLQAVVDDDLSDLTDDDDFLPPSDESNQKVISISLRQRLVPTSSDRIQRLFYKTDKVFSMTKTRGRALIINNRVVSNQKERLGSEADVQNLKDMLTDFKFKVSIKEDLTAEDMLLVIKNEVKDKRHADYGTFWLFLCSHGTESNHIYGSDGVLVNMRDVYDLLTPLNFPGMADKPKLVVIQACAGERIDGGDKGIHEAVPEEEPAIRSTEEPPLVTRPPHSAVGEPLPAKSMTRLNYDDLLVIKSRFESFVSRRHATYGSLMIRCLVQTMYRHACHRDMYEIYRIVQHRVRQFCIKRNLDSGQLVVAQDTLTHLRKLYLFPGYNGSTRKQRSNWSSSDTRTDAYQREVRRDTSTNTDLREARPDTSTDAYQREARPDTSANTDQREARPDTSTDAYQRDARPDTSANTDQREARPDTSTDAYQREARPDTSANTDQREVKPDTSTNTDQREGRPDTSTDTDQREARPGTSTNTDQREARSDTSTNTDQRDARSDTCISIAKLHKEANPSTSACTNMDQKQKVAMSGESANKD